ncbi:MAG: polysaccharide biosynthesis tyrosine autokinase [Candidatus Kuenenia stuttgartiensis]|nr:polysaccharide biosynthesis tyrosine autokinase [Candidatus Kuenenia stuttgartiensis]
MAKHYGGNVNSNLSTLRDYLRVVFRHKAVIITTFITVIISVFVGLELRTPVYEAQVKILVSAQKQIDSPYYRGFGAYEQSEASLTQSEIVISNPVIERAVRALNLHERPPDYEKNYCSSLKAYLIDLRLKMSKLKSDIVSSENESLSYSDLNDNRQIRILHTKGELANPSGNIHEQPYAFRKAVERLKRNIIAEPIRGTLLFTIHATDFNPQSAAMIANVVSRSYIIFDLEQQLAELQLKYGEKQPIVVQLRENIEKLTQNLTGATLPDIEAIGPASVKIIEQALVPLRSTSDKKKISIVLAFFMSIFLGIMFAFGLEYIDHTFKSPRDVETFLNLPLLGAIPKKWFRNKSLLRNTKKATVLNSSYHDLSDQIYLLMKDKKLKALLITAVSHLEGSTTIVANIGLSLAREGHKVLVIDANLKSPEIHEMFKIPNKSGLTHVLEGKIALEEAIKEIDCNLSVLTAGNTTLNPTLLFDSTRMANTIKEAKGKYGFVFVDYANLRNSHDADILSSSLDGTVLVVNESKTKHPVIKALIAPLVQKKANIIGAILNNRTFVIPRILYKRL